MDFAEDAHLEMLYEDRFYVPDYDDYDDYDESYDDYDEPYDDEDDGE